MQLEDARWPGQNRSRHLTMLFGTVESTEMPLIEAAARKKHGWLPLLTTLFLISYGLMTMLIVEQGQTIESQRALIRELFQDSKELSAVKLNAQRHKPAMPPQVLPHNPSPQAAPKQAPSSQAGTQFAQKDQAARKPLRIPAKPVTDIGDGSRTLITI